MAFYEKHGDKLKASVPFSKANLDLDIHKSTDWKNWFLRMTYNDWYNHLNCEEVFKTQGEAKKYWQAFTMWFDAGLSCGKN